MNTNRAETMWVETNPRRSNTSTIRIGNAIAWPFAAVVVIHRLVVLAWAGALTDDFTTVWSAARRFIQRIPVYNETYHHVDPHYLYNPGATLLLSPLGLISSADAARPWFVLLNALAIIAALAWLTKLSGFDLSHPVFPSSIAIAFLTEAVTNTLVFSNINGILLLALVAFLSLFSRKQSWSAGIVLGLAIMIKPMFAPLLLLPLLKLNGKVILGALALPLVFNAIAWPLTPGASDYLDKLVPYLAQTRDYANSSLAGMAVYFGMPGWLHTLLIFIFATAVMLAVVGLARWRFSDEWLWITATSGVLIAGVCLLSSLGQAYYSMMLFPVVFTVFGPRSPMHIAPSWLGIIFCLIPLSWNSPHLPHTGSWLNTFLPTAGWAIFILSTAMWVVTMATTDANSGPSRKEEPHDKRELSRVDRAAVARKAQP